MNMAFNGEPLGAELTDNAHDPDGVIVSTISCTYLFTASVLGSYPVIRALLKRKRKSERTFSMKLKMADARLLSKKVSPP